MENIVYRLQSTGDREHCLEVEDGQARFIIAELIRLGVPLVGLRDASGTTAVSADELYRNFTLGDPLRWKPKSAG